MKGKIKWFSKDKGFGFIVNERGQDIFFGVRDIVGAELPDNLDEVEFQTRQGKKGPAATNVVITSKAQAKKHPHDSGKVECPSCDKNVYPRMVTRYGHPDRSFCPLCGVQLQDFVGTGWRVFRGVLDLFS